MRNHYVPARQQAAADAAYRADISRYTLTDLAWFADEAIARRRGRELSALRRGSNAAIDAIVRTLGKGL